MKTIPHLATLTILTLGTTGATASTVVTATPSAEGLPYRHTITMAEADSATVTRHVGAWSWEDNSLFNAGAGEPPVGWTHTSDWVSLTLLAPTSLTLRFERQEGVANPVAGNPGNLAGITSMFPSFTIYAGTDVTGDQFDTYNNRGALGWAAVTYLDHLDNSTLTSVERTWSLPAGSYSIALGSNAPATDPNRQGYRATLTTIPEPSMTLLASAAALALTSRRRRA